MSKITVGIFAGLWIGAWAIVAHAETSSFQAAKPVWPKGRETEMNLSVGFRAVFHVPADQAAQVELRVAASSIYRATLNGEFLAHGPARGPHGFYRVDVWPLAGRLRAGMNLLAIEVAGYNANSFYLLDQPSFLHAEVVAPEAKRVLAATGTGDMRFEGTVLDDRVQKVQRYSYQRPSSEVYRMTPTSQRWKTDAALRLVPVELAVQDTKPLLARRVPLPDFAVRRPTANVVFGRLEKQDRVARPWKDRSLTGVSDKLKGYAENELATIPSLELQYYRTVPRVSLGTPYDPVKGIYLTAGQYQIVDLGLNATGFIGLAVNCTRKARLDVTFDEILGDDQDVNFKRLSCANVIRYDLEPGQYRLESIEPYTLRYLKLNCLDGACVANDLYLREYAHPPVGATFASSDPRLEKLFAAGVQTFRQNSVDLFMDCPSRERAGWLCDSFFTARAANTLTGATLVEDNFCENFLRPAGFAHLPDGMLPMCYPADHYNGQFIPNWALWFVVQLEEFAARGGDPAIVSAAKPKVLKLFDYFQRFENSDGLLEKLESWVFVEWSAANKFVQDVNYPSNMLYAGALSAAARIYKLPDLAAKADRIRHTIRRQSFDGQFFVDNAKRTSGRLEVTRNRSEVCQYFAFFFGVATRESHAKLWQILRDEFGPQRVERKGWPEIHAANSFIGNMLRMELLSDAGLSRQILDESIAYLLYMADRTGTLWENVGPTASCNHGFASHVCHTLDRDVLGIRRVDPAAKTVHIRLADVNLAWCEGRRPLPGGEIALRWSKEGQTLRYRLQLPQGWNAKVENTSGLAAQETR